MKLVIFCKIQLKNCISNPDIAGGKGFLLLSLDGIPKTLSVAIHFVRPTGLPYD